MPGGTLGAYWQTSTGRWKDRTLEGQRPVLCTVAEKPRVARCHTGNATAKVTKTQQSQRTALVHYNTIIIIVFR